MSIKSYYTRLLFFFIIYLGINLLIIRIKSSDYIYKKILSALKTREPVILKNQLKSANATNMKGIFVNVPAFRKKIGNWSDSQKVTHKMFLFKLRVEY